MNAVKFVEEVRRMRSTDRNYKIFNYNDRPEDVVKEVEEWSAAHPRKTRQSVFLEQWPEAQLDSDKVISVCPKMLYGCCVCPNLDTNRNKDIPCYECRREFWSQEVE